MLAGVCAYVVINQLKLKYGADYTNSGEFLALSLALPLNLGLLSFWPQKKIRNSASMYLLLGLLAQAVLWNFCVPFLDKIPYMSVRFQALSGWALLLYLLLLLPMAIDISFKNTQINTGMFYAHIALLMGLLYGYEASGATIFYFIFALILLFGTVLEIYKEYHYDYLENVASLRSYLSQAVSKFPFKYTIALFSIDNRDKLIKAIKENKMRVLEQMLVNKICEMPYDLTLFRYNETELLMVFKNEDARHTKEYADNIRRNIASSEFVFTNNTSVKITISVCVSEKTRKDLNAAEVINRAHTALQKNSNFNGNVTTIAS